MVRRTVMLGLVVAAATLFATGCGDESSNQSTGASGSSPGSGGNLQRIEVGWIGQLSDAGLIIADKRGYFRGQGLDPKFTVFDSGATMVAPLATGQLDFGAGAFSAGFANAVLQGRPMTMIADKNSYRDGHATDVIEVRKAKVSEIKSPADMRGRKVGIASAPGTTAYVQFLSLLPQYGLSSSDIDLTSYSPPDLKLALREGAVDVGVMSEPTATQAELAGEVEPMMTGADFAPDAQVAVLFTSQKALDDDPELVQRFVSAYACGVRDYRAAVDDGRDRDRVFGELADATSVPKDVLAKARPVGLAPDLSVNEASIDKTIAALQRTDELKEPLKAADLIDNSFAAKATKSSSCPKG